MHPISDIDTLKKLDNIPDSLAYFGINYHKPYYLSSESLNFKFPDTTFRIDFYSICICLFGEIHLEIDNHEHIINQNKILIAAPSTIVKILNIREGSRVKLLFFEKNFLIKNISNPFVIEKIVSFTNSSFRIISLNEESIHTLLMLLAYLQDKDVQNGAYKDDIIRTIIFNILLELAQFCITPIAESYTNTNQDINTLFYKFNMLVQHEVDNHQDVKYYADKLNISNKYLISIVKKTAAKTPHQIINENLLKVALILLGDPDTDITEIAYKLKFSTVSAFSRFFKKNTSLSPSEYRKQQNL